MKLWIDDTRSAPQGYKWCKSVYEAQTLICQSMWIGTDDIELIDIDHDAGDYAKDGGDYIKLLDWMEEIGYAPKEIHIHSFNPVGVENMRRIIQRNGWREV